MALRALRALSDLFSNVRFGIVLLVLLFAYMSVGSAGVIYPVHPNLLHPDAWVHAQLRQWRPFEMTEFEWFHWWPFDLLMGLIAANMAWTTLRRIPFRPVNYGVWGIHAGILMLIAGSVWYFGTKVEGDAAVARRAIAVQVTAADGARGTGRVTATPGAVTQVQAGAETWQVQVAQIDPGWELRTGEAAGEKAYSVMLLVEGPRGRFMRQVIAGRPDLAEDLLLTDDPRQPLQRAVKAKGTAIVETALTAVAEYESQGWFHLKNDLNKSWALYLRRPGGAWAQRPIEGLPLYNDYVPGPGLAFGPDGREPAVHALQVPIPAVSADDPLPDVTLEATGYLRYAFERARLTRGGPDAPLNPAATVEVQVPGGAPVVSQLLAFDPERDVDESELVTFRWAGSAEALAAMQAESHLVFEVAGDRVEVPSQAWNPGAEAWTPVGPAAAGVAMRVVAVQEGLKLVERRVSVAILDLRTPEGQIRRWVFDDPRLDRDMKPGENPDPKAAPRNLAPGVRTRLLPGLSRTPVTLVAGPDPSQLTLIDAADGAVRARPVAVGEGMPLGQDVSLRVSEHLPRAVVQSRPFIVPERQRMKDARERFAMMLLRAPDGRATWLPFHDMVFDRPEEVLRRREFRPTRMRLQDGSEIELVFSRQRLPLPSPVVLESFDLAAHVGGYTGETSTIRDYVSLLRFGDGRGGFGEPVRVSVNQPVEHGGLSYFQAQWDPPDEGGEGAPPSLGLNYTVLGVGSRHGVGLQLAGCVVACLGMIYAFYVKPVIKRRALVQAQRAAGGRGPVVRAAGWWLLAAMAVGAASPGAWAADSTPSDRFRTQLDLRPLEESAVMSEGRVKSLGSFAFGYLQSITGGRVVAGDAPGVRQSPTFTLLDMALRPQAYADADVIQVKNREVRLRLAEAIRAADPGLAEWSRGFERHGMVARSLVWSDAQGSWRPEVAPLMRQLEGDLIRTAKQSDQIRGAAQLMQPDQIRARLRLVPGDQAQWRTLDDASGPVHEAWLRLADAWGSGDVTRVQPLVGALAAALRQAGGQALPSPARLSWESWYFRSGQMTWVWFVFFVAMALLLLGFTWKWPGAMRLGLAAFGVAFLLQTTAVGLRWYVSQRWPNSNMFEAVTTAAWMGSCLAVVAEIGLRRLPVRGLFALAASVGSMVALMACALLPAQLNPAIGNMMPVLHDVWLYIHTNVIIFSYALIFMAAVTAGMYLLWRWRGGPAVHARVGGAGEMLVLASGQGATGAGRVGEILDGVTMTLMEISFVLLWAGIAMGAIWADHSWGRPWGWDPKEVFALNTFVVFALL
ncbi:MAG: hypothetical protein EBQ99_06745, partial [Planctomycetes bacterium]|nr:hypothetical protein [Planctomycetota bacterium]